MIKKDITPRKLNKRIKKAVLIIAASLAGVSIANITATVLIYDALFPRYERPDYAIYPGLYDYEKVKGSLHRIEGSFISGENSLKSYYYPAKSPKALVVLSHGFHAGADDYLPLIIALVEGGYSVFTYDVTGTYSSPGDGTVGMCQSLIDLDNALKTVKRDENLYTLPLLLVGHSWGGYAVSSSLALHPEVKACICIAPMNDGSKIAIEKAEQYVGSLANVGKPVLTMYQRFLFGDYVEYNGVRGINSTNVPVLIAQGISDNVITAEGQSILAHRDEITNPSVEYYYGMGLQGSHTGIWHSKESEEYQKAVSAELKRLKKQKGSALTDEELRQFYSGIDHRLYSEVNPELMTLIFKTFEKGLEK